MHTAIGTSVGHSRRFVFGLIAATAFGLLAPLGAAQCNIPAQVWTIPQPAAADRDQMRACVDSHRAALAGPDMAALVEARKELTGKLADDNLSAAARLIFSEALQADLARMAGQDQTRAINAIRLAGEIGTDRTMTVVLNGLASTDTTVRYAACTAVGRALRTYSLPGLALKPEQGSAAIDRLAALMKEEKDTHVLDAIVRSLAGAASMSGNTDADRLSLQAIKAICDGIAERAASLGANPAPDDLSRVLLRAGEAMSFELGDRHAGGNAPPADVLQSAARMGGQLIAHVARGIRAQKYPTITRNDDDATKQRKINARALISQQVGVGEKTLAFVLAMAAGDPNVQAGGLSELVKTAQPADDAKFLENAKDLLGPGGIVTKAPLNLPPILN